ncbi:MAG: lipopolysaccharide heptosyltransferase II [Planctomycetota bacterium]
MPRSGDMRTGVFLPNWIGDAVMATPSLRALRKLVDSESMNAERGELVAIMRPYVKEVVAGLNWFDDEVLLNRKDDVRRLRAARLDRVVLTNSFRSAWITWRAGIRQRVGYRNDFRSLLLTHPVDRLKWGGVDGTPPVDGYRFLAYSMGAADEPPTLELTTSDEDEQAADEVWRRLGLASGDRVIVLNSGGAFGASKNWPVEHFADLARRIVNQTGHDVLVNCGPAERDNARRIAGLSGSSRVKSLADWPSADAFRVPIGLSKAIIRRSRLLVTTDSGPRFFGIAFGKPVVSLFGPTAFHATRTHYRLEKPVSLELACSPCMKSSCPLQHHRCMQDLPVDRVLNAVVSQLGLTGDQTRAA